MAENMTRVDIFKEISSRTGFSNADVKVIIEEFLSVIKESLIDKYNVQLRGFGTFFRKKRAPKRARNISQGTPVDVPAHEIPAFKPSKSWLNVIKESSKE